MSVIQCQTLFSLKKDFHRVHSSVQTSEYADDLGFYAGADTLQDAEEILQHHLNKFFSWCKTWGLNINKDKTKILYFHNIKKRANIQEPALFLDGIPIQSASTYKFLGMILDAPLLTWKHHIEYLIVSCNKRLNMLKSIAHKRWGADKRILLNFYKTYILGKLNYGAELYNAAAKTHKSKLETIQNSALRIITGGMRSTPVLALQSETQCLSLQSTRDISVLKKFYKIRSQPSYTLLKKNLNKTMKTIINTYCIPTKSPFYYNASLLCNLYGLSLNPHIITSIPPLPPWYYSCHFEFLISGIPNVGRDQCNDIFK